jgi:hypothetical protein
VSAYLNGEGVQEFLTFTWTHDRRAGRAMEGGGKIGHIATPRLPSICVKSHVDVDYS